ncbi:MAG: hypothetical protein ABH879_03735 [archaeon]
MRTTLPRIKKKLAAYVKSEKGKISKQSMVTVGAFIGTAAVAAALASKSVKAGVVTVAKSGNTAVGSHTHY